MLCIYAMILGLWICCLEGKPVAGSAWFAGQAWLRWYADFAGLPELRGGQLLSADYDAHGLKNRIIPLNVPFALHINPGVGGLSFGDWSALKDSIQDTHLQLIFIQALRRRVMGFCTLTAMTPAYDIPHRSVFGHRPPA